MYKLSALVVLSCLLAFALALPETRLQQQQQRQLRQQQQLQHPYLFFTVPQGRANAGTVVQGFEFVEEPEDDDEEADNDDDDSVEQFARMPLRRLPQHLDQDESSEDDDDEAEDLPSDHLPVRGVSIARNGQLVLLNGHQTADEQQEDDEEELLPLLRAKPNPRPINANAQPLLKNAKNTQMLVARDQAGAIMVPDGIIEIEGQSVVDEKTGKSALLVPRAALDAIPDGAVVALMERSAEVAVEEERANRVIFRRRQNGARRNVNTRRRGVRPAQRRRPNSVRRRPAARPNRRRNVRVVRPNGNRNRNRRRGNGQRRRAGQLVLQG